MRQFDEILRKSVKDAFGSYNADHLADKGWQAFAARKSKNTSRGFVLPLWAKAASVLLILTAGTVLTYRILVKNNEREPVMIAAQGPAADTAVVKGGSGPERPRENDGSIPVPAGTAPPGRAERMKSELSAAKTTGTIIQVTGKPGEESLSREADPAGEVPDPLSADPAAALAADTEQKPDDSEQRSALMAEALKNLTEAEYADSLNSTRTKTRESKSAMIAGVSGMMAVIDNAMASAPGIAVGVYFEHQFSRRIAIRPGVAIAMHSSPLENRSGRSDMNYAARLSDGTSGFTDSYNAHLRFVALELPVNMVFRILAKERSALILTAGASTMICLNQSFTGTFKNSYSKLVTNTATGELSTRTNYSTVEVEKTEGAFSHADLFGLANFSAGYLLPFGKSSAILIEPYVQLPVSGITSLDVKIFYSGLSVKMKFGK